MTSISTINSTTSNIHSIDAPKKPTNWTSTKIKQLAIYVFAMLLIYAAIAACLFTPAPYTYLPTVAILPALGLTRTAGQIKDYDNAVKWKEYKDQADKMSFQQIHDEFGLNNALKHNLVTHSELKTKFDRQVKGMDFCSVLKTYKLEELSSLQIATPEHAALIKKLKSQETHHRAVYETAKQSGESLTKARYEFHRQMNALEEQYNLFKKN